MKTRRFFYYGKFVVFGIMGLIAFTFVAMWLWNGLVPELFNGPLLTYWQTIGLLILSKIIFSGVGKGSQGRSKHSHDSKCGDRDKWKRKFEAKMNGKMDQKGDQEEVIIPE